MFVPEYVADAANPVVSFQRTAKGNPPLSRGTEMQSEQAAFKAGDTVRLKSGGPLMTVAGLPADAPGAPYPVVECMWYAGDVVGGLGSSSVGYISHSFNPAVLVKSIVKSKE